MEHSSQLEALAPDLRSEFPRSPRETLAGYVLLPRLLDKCRATLTGRNGEYRFDTPIGEIPSLDRVFFDFAEIDAGEFKDFVATGATDEEVARWVATRAKPRPRIEIIKWNNSLRDFRLSDAPEAAQEYMEDYMARHLPKGRPVYRFLDIYDIEEGRL